MSPLPSPVMQDRDGIAGVLDRYRRRVGAGDLMTGSAPALETAWREMIGSLAPGGSESLAPLQHRAARQVLDLGMAFRLTGDEEERSWPLSPIPLLLGASEWQAIEVGLIQRARLLEAFIADIYGPQQLVRDGVIPPALVAGSRSFWRQMIGAVPPKGRYLQFIAMDLARGPDGEWRVLADYTRTPTGAGYALENRLAMTRISGDLLGRVNVRRLARFFASFREGIASCCERVDPRIALLTPGRFNQSYAEQAHLARYLGFLLVEGDDLIVRDNRLYVRTIEGIKRIDALWRRMDTSFIDPLTFDAQSQIGVPELYEAITRGRLVAANWPGAGIAESSALGGFLPGLSRALLGEDLSLPTIATWWCGQPAERDHVLASFDDLAIGSAFGAPVAGLEEGRPGIGGRLDDERRRMLRASISARPMDYVGQELVQLSTTPAVKDGELTPLPFVLRVFAARGRSGQWRVMPGGLARLAAHGDIRAVLMGEGDLSADVCIVADAPEPVLSLLDRSPTPPIRRVAGTLPSKAADNLFWLGRYLERAETTLRMIRSITGGSIEADRPAAADTTTRQHIVEVLRDRGAIPAGFDGTTVSSLCRIALSGTEGGGSVQSLLLAAARIGQGLRERLSVDYWRLLSWPRLAVIPHQPDMMIEQAAELAERFSALSGLATENMIRGHGWIFHDLGRRIERGITSCRLLKTFATDSATAEDLNVLLDLCDCQISYRTRYLSGLSLHPIRDMLGLEPQNPRSLLFQTDRVREHLTALPSLRDDGMPEAAVKEALAIAAMLAAASAETLGPALLDTIEARLLALSESIGQRFFLRGKAVGRATGMTRLA